MVGPSNVIPWALLPKPTKAGSPASPPTIVVREIGNPEANGMMAPVPATPVAPVGPVGPVMPSAPVAPVGPVAPGSPTAP